MVQRNITIAIIIIVLFIVLAIAAFAIWFMQNHVAFFSRRKVVDEESVEEG
jgi:flagellar basal body-associated protein FliL